MFRPADICLTYPNRWPRSLRDWALSPVYAQIRDWQKLRGYADYGMVHVLVAVSSEFFFEFTVPKARFRPIRDVVHNRRTRWKQFRYAGPEDIDAEAMRRLAFACNGYPYDYFELLDFKIALAAGVRGRVLRLLGNPDNAVRVCSTGAAMLTSKAGIPYDLDPGSVPPAYWANNPRWEIHNWSRHFNRLYERERKE